uniref:Uncharacterized protein n=1 Tax=Timema cristinae TaxID=61476 RepID=A0A7R9CSE3_TIMCR|nr:unnamed protein product [Timema cristinae]
MPTVCETNGVDYSSSGLGLVGDTVTHLGTSRWPPIHLDVLGPNGCPCPATKATSFHVLLSTVYLETYDPVWALTPTHIIDTVQPRSIPQWSQVLRVVVPLSELAENYFILFYHITSLNKELLFTKELVSLEYWTCFSPLRLREKPLFTKYPVAMQYWAWYSLPRLGEIPLFMKEPVVMQYGAWYSPQRLQVKPLFTKEPVAMMCWTWFSPPCRQGISSPLPSDGEIAFGCSESVEISATLSSHPSAFPPEQAFQSPRQEIVGDAAEMGLFVANITVVFFAFSYNVSKMIFVNCLHFTLEFNIKRLALTLLMLVASNRQRSSSNPGKWLYKIPDLVCMLGTRSPASFSLTLSDMFLYPTTALMTIRITPIRNCTAMTKVWSNAAVAILALTLMVTMISTGIVQSNCISDQDCPRGQVCMATSDYQCSVQNPCPRDDFEQNSKRIHVCVRASRSGMRNSEMKAACASSLGREVLGQVKKLDRSLARSHAQSGRNPYMITRLLDEMDYRLPHLQRKDRLQTISDINSPHTYRRSIHGGAEPNSLSMMALKRRAASTNKRSQYVIPADGYRHVTETNGLQGRDHSTRPSETHRRILVPRPGIDNFTQHSKSEFRQNRHLIKTCIGFLDVQLNLTFKL